MRRALLPLLLVLTAVVAACGSEPEPTTGADEPVAVVTPSEEQLEANRKAEAPLIPAERVPLAIRRRLERGEIGLLDAFGKTSIRPENVDFAQDATLEGVDWSAWGSGGATGTGTMRVQECDPNCAEGTVKTVRATITLGEARECDGQRYFSESAVEPETGDAPSSYVRAPC